MPSSLPRQPERVRQHSVLWVNDSPDEYRGNGAPVFSQGPYPHGHIYHAEQGRPLVQVTFEAMNGTATRVDFDPETGEASVRDITRDQRHA